jgi:hypothetical protein
VCPEQPTPAAAAAQDERLHEGLEGLRAKFKAVVATLGKLDGYLLRVEQRAGSLSF